jgi:hypothetical protein
MLYIFYWPDQTRTRPMGLEGEGSRRFSQPGTQVETRKDFFIWIRRNPLKRPDSAKEFQANASLFAWFHLVLLGFFWRLFALRLYLLA